MLLNLFSQVLHNTRYTVTIFNNSFSNERNYECLIYVHVISCMRNNFACTLCACSSPCVQFVKPWCMYYVCMYVFMYVCMYVCMYASTYLHTYVRMYVCMYLFIYLSRYFTFKFMYVCMYWWMDGRMNHGCMHVCIYMFMHIWAKKNCLPKTGYVNF